jgi:dynein heavy chain
LAKSNDLEVIQQNLRTCFDNIMRLEIKDQVDIIAMISAEKERIPIAKQSKCKGNVESWLLLVQENMKDTIRKVLKTALLDFNQVPERKVWVTKHPGQGVTTIS